ncbi:MAG: OmpA family protein [Rheinheimera sp.]|nr:OmpA family protein [Rheinheimera sp.]
MFIKTKGVAAALPADASVASCPAPRKLALWFCSACVLVLPQIVLADSYRMESPSWYGGASVGESRLSIDTSQLERDMQAQGLPLASLSRNTNDTGYKIYAGTSLNDYLALEGGYFRLGEVDFSAVTAATPGGSTYPLAGHLRDQGANLDLVARMLLSSAFAVTARLGLTYNDTDSRLDYQRPIKLDQYDRSKHYLKHKFGAGLEYQLTPAWGMRLELERYRLDDIWGDQGDMKLLSLGLVYQYGQHTAYAEPTAAPTPTTAPEPYADPPPPAAPEAAPVLIELADVHFEFNQSALTPAAKTILAQHIATLKAQPDSRVQIAGYTSASGTDAYNQQLSERRAQAVLDYLTNAGGLTPARLTSIGYGEASPAAVEKMPSELRSNAAMANMRVLFRLLLQ